MFSVGGWLFADLFLAVTVLFIVATARAEPPPVPRISGFTPVSGPVGTRITISGEHFVNVQRVTIADVSAPFSVTSSNEVVATVPPEARTGLIDVTTPLGTATSAAPFTLIVPSPTPAPTLTPTLTPTPTRTPTLTPFPTETPIPTPTPCTRTVILMKHEIQIDAGPGGTPPTDAQLRAALAPYQGRRAGLLLTFGRGGLSPEPGKRLALEVNDRLQRLLPRMFGSETIMEGYHYLGGPINSVELNAYFFNEECG